jgi:hypothetical protein
MMMMTRAALLLLSMVAYTQSLSCMDDDGSFTLTNALHASEISVVVKIFRDITPPPKPQVPMAIEVNVGNETHPVYVTEYLDPPQIAGMPEPRYYTGWFQNVLSGGHSTGHIIVRGGIACGVDMLQQATYVMFGTIQNEAVEGYVGQVPVFYPHGTPYTQKPILAYSENDRKKIWAFAKGARTCEPQDCAALTHFAVLPCPDGVSTAGQSTLCTFQNGGCGYTVIPHTCPTCKLDADCQSGLVCDTHGLCALP